MSMEDTSGSSKSCRGMMRGIQNEIIRRSLEGIRHKVLVMSGKGGVGKSSVAVGLAVNAHRRGYRVGLLDADLHGPSVPGLLGLKQRMAVIREDRSIEPLVYRDGLEVISLESLFRDKDTAVIWRGPLKNNMIRQFISDVPWGKLDFLIVDVPPGTGDEPLTIAKTIPDVWAVLVTTPQEVSLADVRKAIRFCREVRIRIAGVVENMSGLWCPHCGEIIPVFKTGGGERMAMEAGVPFLGKIPMDPEMVRSGDAGVPLSEMKPDSPAALSISGIVENLKERMDSEQVNT